MIHIILDIIVYAFTLLMIYQLIKQGAFKMLFFALKKQIRQWYRTTYFYKIVSGIKTKINRTFFKKRTVKNSLKVMDQLKPLKGEKEYTIKGTKINAKNRAHAEKIYQRILNLDVIYTKQNI